MQQSQSFSGEKFSGEGRRAVGEFSGEGRRAGGEGRGGLEGGQIAIWIYVLLNLNQYLSKHTFYLDLLLNLNQYLSKMSKQILRRQYGVQVRGGGDLWREVPGRGGGGGGRRGQRCNLNSHFHLVFCYYTYLFSCADLSLCCLQP